MPFADLKTTEYVGSLRRQPVRVLSPREPFPDWYAVSQAEVENYIGASGGALVHLARWISLAAGCKKSIVYLPRTGFVPVFFGPCYESCDLVLCHHSLGLRWAHWIEVGRSLSRIGPKSISIRKHQSRGMLAISRKFPLDFGVRGRTMFIVGDVKSFAWLADECRSYADYNPGAHVHLMDHSRPGWPGDLQIEHADFLSFERAENLIMG